MKLSLEEIARLCHEVNRAYCSALGDESQLPWEEAPDWQRSSAWIGVAHHLSNPEATPSESHESWMRVKAEEGWKYGPVKDVEKKEHPCFLPYEDLPADQRAKDYIFTAIVKTVREYV
jgi:cytochrome c1